MSTSLYTPDEALAEQTFLHDAFVKLRRRKWSILLTGIVLSVVLAAAIQMLPKKYHGIATVEAYTAAFEKLQKAGTISPIKIEKASS